MTAIKVEWTLAKLRAELHDFHSFPTQDQMLKYLDASNASRVAAPLPQEVLGETQDDMLAGIVSAGGTAFSTGNQREKLYPFSIEVKSEETLKANAPPIVVPSNVGESISSTTNISGIEGSLGGLPSMGLFRFNSKRKNPQSASVRGPTTTGVSERDVKRSRMEGDHVHSKQSRFFVAMPLATACRFAQLVPPHQQHLYEIIRAGEPCHFYLDVEREVDAKGANIIQQFTAESSSELAALRSCFPSYTNGKSDHELIHEALEKAAKMRKECQWWHTCPTTCTTVPDDAELLPVLIAELQEYLSASLQMDIPEESLLIMTSRFVGRPGESVVPPPNKKTSHHLLLRLEEVCYADNSCVGEVVRGFVDHVYRKVERLRDDSSQQSRFNTLHAALFFHAPPTPHSMVPVSMGDGSAEIQHTWRVPLLLLKPVIDTGVYSRNRMFRCLGSCKLNKQQVLCLNEAYKNSTRHLWAADEIFKASLVMCSRSSTERQTVIYGGQYAGEGTSNSGTAAALRQRPASRLGSFDDKGIRGAAKQPPTQYPMLDEFIVTVAKQDASSSVDSRNSGRGSGPLSTNSNISIKRYVEVEKAYILYTMEGTRYCGNINRHHKSNAIYYVVCLVSGTFCQKCFDPDCSGYRSPSRVVPDDILRILNPEAEVGALNVALQNQSHTEAVKSTEPKPRPPRRVVVAIPDGFTAASNVKPVPFPTPRSPAVSQTNTSPSKVDVPRGEQLSEENVEQQSQPPLSQCQHTSTVSRPLITIPSGFVAATSVKPVPVFHEKPPKSASPAATVTQGSNSLLTSEESELRTTQVKPPAPMIGNQIDVRAEELAALQANAKRRVLFRPS